MRISFPVVESQSTPRLSRHTGCLATQGWTLSNPNLTLRHNQVLAPTTATASSARNQVRPSTTPSHPNPNLNPELHQPVQPPRHHLPPLPQHRLPSHPHPHPPSPAGKCASHPKSSTSPLHLLLPHLLPTLQSKPSLRSSHRSGA